MSQNTDLLNILKSRALTFSSIRITSHPAAPIIIAPHGASLLLTTFSSENTCIREFMPPNNPVMQDRILEIIELSDVYA